MQLTDLRPCDGCGGPLLGPGGSGFFYQVKLQISLAMLNPREANPTLGLAKFFGLRDNGAAALKLAEAFLGNDPVVVTGEAEPSLMTHMVLLLCQGCSLDRTERTTLIDVARLVDRAHRLQKKRDEDGLEEAAEGLRQPRPEPAGDREDGPAAGHPGPGGDDRGGRRVP